MSDLEQIRRVMAEYCQMLDGRRYVEFGELFAPDGVWTLGGYAYHGPAAVTAFMDQLLLDHPHRRSCHMHTNLSIDLDGETASALSDYVMFTRTGAGPWGALAIGTYVDRLTRREVDGAWRFVERRLVR